MQDLIAALLPAQRDNLKLVASEGPRSPYSTAPLLERAFATYRFPPAWQPARMRTCRRSGRTGSYDYRVILAAGRPGIGRGLAAVLVGMDGFPLATKHHGSPAPADHGAVTVKPRTAPHLPNTLSPETTFKRVFAFYALDGASTRTARSPNAVAGHKGRVLLFDFAPDRASGKIADYSFR
jgi:hypothetical protein